MVYFMFLVSLALGIVGLISCENKDKQQQQITHIEKLLVQDSIKESK